MPAKIDSLPDTNAVLRYLLRDEPAQFEEAKTYFEKVRIGREKVLLLESVLVECIYVLTKFYQVPKAEAVESLSFMLRYKGVVNPDKDILLAALALFARENIDLVDCIMAASALHRQIPMFSFDKKLIKLGERLHKPLPND